MHRRLIISMLGDYEPTSRKQEKEKQYMLDFVMSHDDCFSRKCRDGHITCGCFLENFDGTKFLLTKHKKSGLWLQVGGHADGESNPIEVAKREAYEESGLTCIEPISEKIFSIGIHMSPEILTYPPHFHYDINFLFRATNAYERIKMSEDESLDLQWFSELPNEPYGIGLEDMLIKWKHIHEKVDVVVV